MSVGDRGPAGDRVDLGMTVTATTEPGLYTLTFLCHGEASQVMLWPACEGHDLASLSRAVAR